MLKLDFKPEVEIWPFCASTQRMSIVSFYFYDDWLPMLYKHGFCCQRSMNASTPTVRMTLTSDYHRSHSHVAQSCYSVIGDKPFLWSKPKFDHP